MYSDYRNTLLHLSLIPDIGPQAHAALLKSFGKDLAELYTLNAQELSKRSGLHPLRAEKIVQGLADSSLLLREKALIEKHSIGIVTLLDADYPSLLGHIHAPPLILYYKGDLSILRKTLAFVGSRKADAYGQQVVNKLIPDVVSQSFTTISGGALGIDGMVHRATLQAHGKTVAVFGSGLLDPYPLSHKGLFRDIVEQGGMIMSAFPLLTSPLPWNFPARNRIISGLSRATIVIQAARKSGALLTARNALDEGRDVGAVPGSIFNEISVGCHDLIAQGAKPIFSVEDIYSLIDYNDITIQKSVEEALAEVETDPLVVLCITPKTMDELVILTGYTRDVLQDRLWTLQMENRIEQNILGMWCCRE